MRTALSKTIALVFALCLAPAAIAQNVSVRASAGSSTAFIGQPLRFNIEIRGANNAEQPVIDAVDGLDIRFAGEQDRSSTFTQIINGRRTERSTRAYIFQWLLSSPRAGDYSIPPVEVTVAGVRYTTKPVTVRFVEPPTTEDMLLDVSIDRESAFVGEPVRLTIDWYVSKKPENWSFTLAGEFLPFEIVSPSAMQDRKGTAITMPFMGRQVSARQASIRSEGVAYTRVRIEQMLIPRRAGTLRIDPISVSSELVIREGFMRNIAEFYIAKAPPIELEVRELPSEGRPRNFTGLIGEYSVSAIASTDRANVGDPIEITLAISGPIVDAVRPPALHLQSDLAGMFRVPEDLGLSQIENGKKVWRFTIRPESDDILAIPPIELPYFDTERGEYAIASSAPLALDVSAARQVTLTDAEGARLSDAGIGLEDSGAGIAYIAIGDELLADHRFILREALAAPLAIAAAAGPFSFWALSAVFIAARRRSNGSREHAERRRALPIAQRELADAASPDGVSRAIYGYFGRKLGRSPSGLTPDECALLCEQIDAAASNELRELLDACDASSYAGQGSADSAGLASRAGTILASLDASWRAER